MTDLEHTVHNQINDILEAKFGHIDCACEDIPERMISQWLNQGLVPGYSQIECTYCQRKGVLVFTSERWAILAV